MESAFLASDAVSARRWLSLSDGGPHDGLLDPRFKQNGRLVEVANMRRAVDRLVTALVNDLADVRSVVEEIFTELRTPSA